jgi:hypothetical protein
MISLFVSLCQLACLIRFGDALAPSEPPTDDVGSGSLERRASGSIVVIHLEPG